MTARADIGDGDSDGIEIASNFSFVVGYVSKQWSSDVKGKTIRENMWREEGKRLHGIQFGFAYTPTLPMGMGIYTGLFAEGYFSFSKKMGYDEFTEFSLYVPIHANVKLPLSKDVAPTTMPITGHGCGTICWVIIERGSNMNSITSATGRTGGLAASMPHSK